VFGFGGVMWIGISGGVLLAACSSIAHGGVSSTSRKRLTSDVAADILSTFFSAIAFYISLNYFEDGSRLEIGGKFCVPNGGVLASCIMALTHFAQSRALAYLLASRFFGRHQKAGARNFLLIPALNSGISWIATIFSFIVFTHFGIEFGLVIVPLAVLGHLSYKIHIRRLE